MATISICYETCGAAPRTLFDVVYTEEDAEGGASAWQDVFDAEYDRYIQPLRAEHLASTLVF